MTGMQSLSRRARRTLSWTCLRALGGHGTLAADRSGHRGSGDPTRNLSLC
jgi:hypothetical protein